jgi:hypothetical protein
MGEYCSVTSLVYRWTDTYSENCDTGEYTLKPVTIRAFDKWCRKNGSDLNHGLQYANESVTIPILKTPHDGAAGIVAAEIMKAVSLVMNADEARAELELYAHTGCTV